MKPRKLLKSLENETNLWGSLHISWVCVAFLKSQKYLFYHEWISSLLSPSWIIFSAYCPALGKGGEFSWVMKEDPCLNRFYLLSPQRQGGRLHGRWWGTGTKLLEFLDASEQSWPSQLAVPCLVSWTCPQFQPVLTLVETIFSDLLLSLKTSLSFNCREDKRCKPVIYPWPMGGSRAERDELGLKCHASSGPLRNLTALSELWLPHL